MIEAIIDHATRASLSGLHTNGWSATGQARVQWAMVSRVASERGPYCRAGNLPESRRPGGVDLVGVPTLPLGASHLATCSTTAFEVHDTAHGGHCLRRGKTETHTHTHDCAGRAMRAMTPDLIPTSIDYSTSADNSLDRSEGGLGASGVGFGQEPCPSCTGNRSLVHER